MPGGKTRDQWTRQAKEIERLTAEVREANHEKHMAVVKKFSEISSLKSGWLDAIKAIDWFEEQTAEPCEPYPQSERDEDRKWLEDSTTSGSPTPMEIMSAPLDECLHGISAFKFCDQCESRATNPGDRFFRIPATADQR